MKRSEYKAELWQWDKDSKSFIPLDSATAYAHNSGIRKSEGLAREHARKLGIMLHGERSNRNESGYSRIWRSADGSVMVMTRVEAA